MPAPDAQADKPADHSIGLYRHT